ncbi:hypothetical protein [Streptomyces tailanensis]|uniref:hypothetical protein n=1 Tax=Streptomyces tailanensis TaxID=2569858 RepID=UPI00122E50D5|nr:hypothetical protein [Streptomyces tailanensis]
MVVFVRRRILKRDKNPPSASDAEGVAPVSHQDVDESFKDREALAHSIVEDESGDDERLEKDKLARRERKVGVGLTKEERDIFRAMTDAGHKAKSYWYDRIERPRIMGTKGMFGGMPFHR